MSDLDNGPANAVRFKLRQQIEKLKEREANQSSSAQELLNQHHQAIGMLRATTKAREELEALHEELLVKGIDGHTQSQHKDS